MLLLVAFLLVSIVFSFLCSLWEAVLLSITPAFAEIKQQEGSPIGATLQRFKRDIDEPLSAILTLNTIAHTVGAIGVGAQATKLWGATSPWVTQVVVPVLMTLAILVLSELIPKTLGAVHWQRLAGFTVRSLRVLVMLLGPLIWLSRHVTGVLKKDAAGSLLSRSDFLAMANLGAREGVFEHHETEIIANLLRFEEVLARDVMTPRTVVVAAPEEMTIADFHAAHPDLRFSRIPTYHEGSKDLITGFVMKDDLLEKLVAEQGTDTIASARRAIMVVPEDFPLPELFFRLLSRRSHIAVVVDEFGGMAGICTIEDVIETLLGLEIVDESDAAADMQKHARQQWRRRAAARGLDIESAGDGKPSP
ncbi:MAG: CNNM domain-containing protein [Gammaproteobacteria bacterium]